MNPTSNTNLRIRRIYFYLGIRVVIIICIVEYRILYYHRTQTPGLYLSHLTPSPTSPVTQVRIPSGRPIDRGTSQCEKVTLFGSAEAVFEDFFCLAAYLRYVHWDMPLLQRITEMNLCSPKLASCTALQRFHAQGRRLSC
ncbi:hypothetical protein ARMGADRAFT_491955 [Armillaria gallica]|uniref:Uncharacterized protein n=1 Tax=Armillaria gallica TaxID=47427 RepID=A0A2H3DZ52_ARMGA|nr:hypothetical protein ARMGADRAFT_491955 [Armillaria gallica]